LVSPVLHRGAVAGHGVPSVDDTRPGHTKSELGNHHFSMGKSTISMAIYYGKSPFGIGKSTFHEPCSIANC